jgi:hypothetical protein
MSLQKKRRFESKSRREEEKRQIQGKSAKELAKELARELAEIDRRCGRALQGERDAVLTDSTEDPKQSRSITRVFVDAMPVKQSGQLRLKAAAESTPSPSPAHSLASDDD